MTAAAELELEGGQGAAGDKGEGDVDGFMEIAERAESAEVEVGGGEPAVMIKTANAGVGEMGKRFFIHCLSFYRFINVRDAKLGKIRRKDKCRGEK